MERKSKNLLKLVFSTLAIFLLFSCQEKQPFLSKEELLAYMELPENGLIREKELGDKKLRLQYKPTDLLVDQELGSAQNPDTAEVKRLREKYSPYAYFVMDLSSEAGNLLYQDMSRFGERLQTMAFRMDQYVFLTTSAKDTIPVADFNFPRLYNHSPSVSVLFVFDREKIRGTEWIDFHLKETGLGTGHQQLRFETPKINHTPKILF